VHFKDILAVIFTVNRAHTVEHVPAQCSRYA